MTEQATILEGLEISIHALVQSINGLTQREERLRARGLHERADEVRLVTDRLYALRDELVRILEKQRWNRTDMV